MTAPQRRVLFVHAHPDDETINNGATMARYAAEGAWVGVVTCTLGEEGEILVPELAQLSADAADQLGGWRIAELRQALAELGVCEHRFLGGAGHFRDSGMLGTPANHRPRAFWRADQDPAVFAEAVGLLAGLIRHWRPQVLVSYDSDGGYGHPDHVMAHRVTLAAAEAAAEPADEAPGWAVAKVYEIALPASAAAVPDPAASPFQPVAERPSRPDDSVTTAVPAPAAARAAKQRALAAHATQVSVQGDWFALSNGLGQPVDGIEYYRLVQGRLGPERDADGRETDLFAGLPGRAGMPAASAMVDNGVVPTSPGSR